MPVENQNEHWRALRGMEEIPSSLSFDRERIWESIDKKLDRDTKKRFRWIIPAAAVLLFFGSFAWFRSKPGEKSFPVIVHKNLRLQDHGKLDVQSESMAMIKPGRVEQKKEKKTTRVVMMPQSISLPVRDTIRIEKKEEPLVLQVMNNSVTENKDVVTMQSQTFKRIDQPVVTDPRELFPLSVKNRRPFISFRHSNDESDVKESSRKKIFGRKLITIE